MSKAELKRLLSIEMKKPLSDSDIYHMTNNRVNVIEYSKLHKVKKLRDILKNGSVIVLYETSKNSGHWVIVSELNKNEAEFADFYSLSPDQELSWVSKTNKKKLNEGFPEIMRLLLPYKTTYVVPYRLQKMNSNTSTCGRWCVYRFLNKRIPLMKFYRLVKEKSKKLGLTPDELVTVEIC